MASLTAQLVKSPPAMQEPRFDSLVRKIPWRKERLPTPVFLSFPDGSACKKSTWKCGRPGFDPWVGKIPLEKGQATHSSILAWKIPWTTQSMGSQRVGHDWVTFTYILFIVTKRVWYWQKDRSMELNSLETEPWYLKIKLN